MSKEDSRVRRVARYEAHGIIINTIYWENKYETSVKHPVYSEGKWFLVVQYYDTLLEAQSGHEAWVDRINSGLIPNITSLPLKKAPPLNDGKANLKTLFKITFHALIKILIQYTDSDNQLRAVQMRNRADLILVSIPGGKGMGSLVYNRTNKTANAISALWLSILEETRAEKQDEDIIPFAD